MRHLGGFDWEIHDNPMPDTLYATPLWTSDGLFVSVLRWHVVNGALIYDSSVARLGSDGLFDPSFGGGTVPVGGLGAPIVETHDGKLIVWGADAADATAPAGAFVRLQPDGALDPTFRLDGRLPLRAVSSGFPCAAVADGEGRLLVVFYNDDGTHELSRILP